MHASYLACWRRTGVFFFINRCWFTPRWFWPIIVIFQFFAPSVQSTNTIWLVRSPVRHVFYLIFEPVWNDFDSSYGTPRSCLLTPLFSKVSWVNFLREYCPALQRFASLFFVSSSLHHLLIDRQERNQRTWITHTQRALANHSLTYRHTFSLSLPFSFRFHHLFIWTYPLESTIAFSQQFVARNVPLIVKPVATIFLIWNYLLS